MASPLLEPTAARAYAHPAISLGVELNPAFRDETLALRTNFGNQEIASSALNEKYIDADSKVRSEWSSALIGIGRKTIYRSGPASRDAP
jgi:hypothetical protein